MDPVSITAGCLGILAAVGPLVFKVRQFAVGLHESRKEMSAIDQDLSSLEWFIRMLQNDCNDPMFQYHSTLRQSLTEVLGRCATLMKEMTTVIDEMASGNLGRKVEWEMSGREKLSKLKLRLEAYKGHISLHLQMLSVLQTREIKHDISNTLQRVKVVAKDTEVIRKTTSCLPQIQQDVSQIPALIALFKTRGQDAILDHAERGMQDNILLDRFMEDTCSYAELTYDEMTSVLGEMESQIPEGSIEAHIPANNRHQETLSESCSLPDTPYREHKVYEIQTDLAEISITSSARGGPFHDNQLKEAIFAIDNTHINDETRIDSIILPKDEASVGEELMQRLDKISSEESKIESVLATDMGWINDRHEEETLEVQEFSENVGISTYGVPGLATQHPGLGSVLGEDDAPSVMEKDLGRPADFLVSLSNQEGVEEELDDKDKVDIPSDARQLARTPTSNLSRDGTSLEIHEVTQSSPSNREVLIVQGSEAELPTISEGDKRNIDTLLKRAGFRIQSHQEGQERVINTHRILRHRASDRAVLDKALIWAITPYGSRTSPRKGISTIEIPTANIVQHLINKGADVNALVLKEDSIYRSTSQSLKAALTVGYTTQSILTFWRKVPILHFAIENGLQEHAKIIILNGADINLKGFRMSTALQIAATNDFDEIVTLLASKGADLEAKDHIGRTALHLAVSLGRQRSTKALVESGANVNAQDVLTSAAAQRDNASVLRILLSSGADVHARSHRYGMTALHQAAYNGNIENVETLLEFGADSMSTCGSIGRLKTPLQLVKGHFARYPGSWDPQAIERYRAVFRILERDEYLNSEGQVVDQERAARSDRRKEVTRSVVRSVDVGGY